MPSGVDFLDESDLEALLSAAELRDVLYNVYWRLERQPAAGAAAAPHATSEGPALPLSELVTASCGLGHLPLHYRDDEVAGAVTRTRRRRGEEGGDLIDGVCVLYSAGGGAVLAVARLPPLRLQCEAACVAAFVGRVASSVSVSFHGFTSAEAAKLRAAAAAAAEVDASATAAEVAICRGVEVFRRALASVPARAAPTSWLVFATEADDEAATLPLPPSAASVVCDPISGRRLSPAFAAAGDSVATAASDLFAAAPASRRLRLPAVAVLSPDSPLVCLAACKFAYEKRLSTGPRK